MVSGRREGEGSGGSVAVSQENPWLTGEEKRDLQRWFQNPDHGCQGRRRRRRRWGTGISVYTRYDVV